MTQDEVVQLAKQVGIRGSNVPALANGQVEAGIELLEAFANLVAAKEREACAKVCEEYADDARTGTTCAKTIRQRGQA
jgi:hypothetical protein